MLEFIGIITTAYWAAMLALGIYEIHCEMRDAGVFDGDR